MTIKTKEWKPEDHVRDTEDVVELLRAGFETGEMADVRFALKTLAKSQGMRVVAERTGISRQALHGVLDGAVDPKLSTVLGLLGAVGLTLRPERLDDGSTV